MKKFFDKIENLEDLRKEYHRLAFINHPDKGGDVKTMQLINDQYDKLSKTLISCNETYSESRKEYEQQVSEELREKLSRIIHLPGIVIELIGSWLWLSGDTFNVREILKDEGFSFSHTKGAWYWHKGEYFKKSGQILTMEQIRDYWGHKKVESEPSEQLN